MLLQGVFPAITTPFYPDGRIYFRKLEHNVAKYSLTDIAGFVVLGSTGEVVMLSDGERREILLGAIEAAGGNKIMIAGTGAESVRGTLEMTEAAAEFGYDAALVRTPHYYKSQMTTAVMANFYRTVADRSALPVLIYSVPPFTGYDIPTEVVKELADHPNVIGIKESSGSVEKIAQMAKETAHVRRTVSATLRRSTGRRDVVSVSALAGTSTVVEERTQEVGFQILAGSAQKMLPSLEAGASGAVLAFGCVAPVACVEVHKAFRAGDIEKAKAAQEKIVGPATRIASQLGVAGVKYGMDFNGYYGGNPRLPLLPVSSEVRAEIEGLLGDLRG
ncbi:dihydrodipicolinate synthetase [Candidatus Koribacter versatilis Ellin345]|uniref:Dihydrodipicolinate synthetase n=1 Tax=Koribacter versatilis (strain Ellin345) TaxID=204669 RepID=Q1IN83_KORVE|nr:dihydrodipicolinate synthase family protein [Candidatus Koribacter versatilis]ABF41667.1 dihydrodipicolinate synthetase [Candidatus Koribacter versatilis Ellin345]